MSHTVTVKMISDQDIQVDGVYINVYEVRSIFVDGHGRIVDWLLEIPMPEMVLFSEMTPEERARMSNRTE